MAYHYTRRVQTDVCVMIGDAKEKGLPVVVVKKKKNKVGGDFSIKDTDTSEVIMDKIFKVDKSGKTTTGFLGITDE